MGENSAAPPMPQSWHVDATPIEVGSMNAYRVKSAATSGAARRVISDEGRAIADAGRRAIDARRRGDVAGACRGVVAKRCRRGNATRRELGANARARDDASVVAQRTASGCIGVKS